jgi:hypothetical protein
MCGHVSKTCGKPSCTELKLSQIATIHSLFENAPDYLATLSESINRPNQSTGGQMPCISLVLIS